MGYFPEVHINQKRKIKNEVFEVIDIRCSNIEHPNDYITVITLKGATEIFQEKADTVIKEYQLVTS